MKKMQDTASPGHFVCRRMLILKTFLVILLWSTCLVSGYRGHAQERTTVTVNMTDVTLNEVITELKKQTKYDFFYNSELVKSKGRVSVRARNLDLREVLEQVLTPVGLEYAIQQDLITIRERRVQQEVAKIEMITVSGKVTDKDGNPGVGATLVIHGTTLGVATDVDGKYSLMTRPDDVLTISFIGYKTEVVPVKENKHLNVILSPASEDLEEVTVVAFGQQKKESVVSAITTVRPMDLKSSNSDLTSSFAGKIAGMVGWQTGGLPAALTEDEMNTKFYIRGITSFQTGANVDPLILLDGVESSKLDLARIAPEDIETFSVMKDASATAMYGARGANGVILVTTKKGQEGSVYATARYETVFSMPTKRIDVVDPVDYMKMYNRALLTRDPLATPKYSVERINRTRSGKYPSWVYPANDWYKILFKNYNVNHHAGLNIRGGSKVIQYYASVNYNRDQGMLKTDKLNDFDCNITNNQTAFRVNLTIDLKAGIKLLINSSTTIDKYHGPLTSVNQAYELAFNASPVDFAPLYPGDENYGWPHLRFGTTEANQENPYMMIQKGYLERTRYSTTNRAEYIHNLSGLVKGLELRGSVAVSQAGYYTTGFTTNPFKYSLLNYDFETGKHRLQDLSPFGASYALSIDPTAKASTTETRVTYEARALHTAAWKEHQTSLTGVFQAQDYTFTPVSNVLTGMPQRNMMFSMRGTYGFKDRYFVEASFGYNASERFAKSNRWGLFPAGGLAYVISSEPFMNGTAHWLNFLKLRVSYGKVGNDGVIKVPRFLFLQTMGTLTNVLNPEPGSGSTIYRIVQGYANPNLKWEVAEQVNFGLETKLFKGIVEFNLDAYQEIRHNIIGYRASVPAHAGIALPQLDNMGKARSRGIDFSGKIQHAFNKDLWVILNGTLTYNKVVYKEIEEAMNKPAWQSMVGKEISQKIGYISDGLFQDQAEIENAPVQAGSPQPGDIRYRDLNNDGKIDVNDVTYIGFPETPRVTYGFSGFVNYRNFEFSFAFQGSGKRSFFMDPSELSPFVDDHAMLTAIYEDHWSEDNMSRKPFWPRLSTQNLIKHSPEEDWYNKNATEVRKSTYFMRECRFLRCTSLELAYNMPKKLMERWGLQNMKFFVRANNPFLISNFKLWDVELGEDAFNYPIQKTYTVGLNFSF